MKEIEVSKKAYEVLESEEINWDLDADLKLELNKIYNMDCIEGMKQLDDDSIDSIVTDPPYNLSTIKRFKAKDSGEKWSVKSGVYHRMAKGFMGQEWDNEIAFQKELWEECLRVAKPGATLLAFGHPRTYHRMTCAVEAAGWIIRDCIMWLYGSGFPTSLNIGMQVDKIQGNDREVIGKKIHSQKGVKIAEERTTIGAGAYGEKRERNITKGNSEWEGYETALKPAYEPIIVAMKPNDGGYAENALKHGVAGLNIDGCRIGAQGRFPTNLILDKGSAMLIDEQSGSSRFFYCAKPPKSEKNAGCECTHPCVKPLSLMEYLCKLTKTPTGGIVLDPFSGSGTTLLACKKIGRPYIGFEISKEYCDIARKRLASHVSINKWITKKQPEVMSNDMDDIDWTL